MMTKIELENLDRDTLVNMLIGADNRCTELERLVVGRDELTKANVKISSLEHEVYFLKNALTKILRIAEEESKLARISQHVRELIYD